jgi:hypothetical protein
VLAQGPVKPGDLLVSGPEGAAVVRDPTPGTRLGKALSSLGEGRGEVLVLVTLG